MPWIVTVNGADESSHPSISRALVRLEELAGEERGSSELGLRGEPDAVIPHELAELTPEVVVVRGGGDQRASDELHARGAGGMLSSQHVAAATGSLRAYLRDHGDELHPPARGYVEEVLEILRRCPWGARLEAEPSPAEAEELHRAHLLESGEPLSGVLVLEHKLAEAGEPAVYVFEAGATSPSARVVGETVDRALEAGAAELARRLAESEPEEPWTFNGEEMTRARALQWVAGQGERAPSADAYNFAREWLDAHPRAGEVS